MEPCLIHLLFAQNISLHLLHSKNSGQILVLKSRWSRGAAACIVETLQRSTDPTWRSAISKETDLFPLLVFFNRVMVMPSFGGPGTEHTLLLLVCVCVCASVCVRLHAVPSKHTYTVQTHINSDDRWVTDWNITSGEDQRKEVIQIPPPHPKHNTHRHTHRHTHDTKEQTQTCEYIINEEKSPVNLVCCKSSKRK